MVEGFSFHLHFDHFKTNYDNQWWWSWYSLFAVQMKQFPVREGAACRREIRGCSPLIEIYIRDTRVKRSMCSEIYSDKLVIDEPPTTIWELPPTPLLPSSSSSHVLIPLIQLTVSHFCFCRGWNTDPWDKHLCTIRIHVRSHCVYSRNDWVVWRTRRRR